MTEDFPNPAEANQPDENSGAESSPNPPESPADLLARAAEALLPAEDDEDTGHSPLRENALNSIDPEIPELESAAKANEPPAPAGSIEETVLAPETETPEIAAEPDLDTALETSNQNEGAEPLAQSSPSANSQTTASAKPAPQLVKREDGPENSPFSVIVSQVYEGPLDLLLDLIRKQDIDIYNIPIAKITAQFLAYVNHLRASDMDVAGDFIYTASLLIHIKSKMLLPREPLGTDDTQEDPRRELVERLLEHERFKNAAQMLQQKQILEEATWTNPGVKDFVDDVSAEPEIAADTVDLVRIFRDILERARNRPVMNLEEDTVTVGQMIQFLSRRLTMEDKPIALRRLLAHTKSERALIAMFLALLELVRLQAILLKQDVHFSEIFIKKNSGFDAVMDQGLVHDDWQ